MKGDWDNLVTITASVNLCISCCTTGSLVISRCVSISNKVYFEHKILGLLSSFFGFWLTSSGKITHFCSGGELKCNRGARVCILLIITGMFFLINVYQALVSFLGSRLLSFMFVTFLFHLCPLLSGVDRGLWSSWKDVSNTSSSSKISVCLTCAEICFIWFALVAPPTLLIMQACNLVLMTVITLLYLFFLISVKSCGIGVGELFLYVHIKIFIYYIKYKYIWSMIFICIFIYLYISYYAWVSKAPEWIF